MLNLVSSVSGLIKKIYVNNYLTDNLACALPGRDVAKDNEGASIVFEMPHVCRKIIRERERERERKKKLNDHFTVTGLRRWRLVGALYIQNIKTHIIKLDV